MKPTIEAIKSTVLSVFPDAERIVLFGSRAAGSHREDSDYDLLIVVATPLRPARRGAIVRLALRKFEASFDIMVFTPEEFRQQARMKSSAVYSAISGGRVLHEVA